MRESLTIYSAFELYRNNYLAMRGAAKKTDEGYAIARNVFIRYIGDIDIEKITFAHVRDCKFEMDKDKTASTVRGYICQLRVVLRYFKNLGYNVLDPDSIPLPKRIQKAPEFATPKDVKLLIKGALERVRGYPKISRLRNAACISLIFGSGIRISELTALNRRSIVGGTFTVFGKGSKSRLCFIDTRTQKLINEYLALRDDDNEALFLSNQSQNRMTAKSLQLAFRKICARSDTLGDIHPHLLRHGFATNLLRNNTNMRYVQEFLGHTSLQTTQMYTHVVNEDLRAIYLEKHSIN